MTYYNNTDTCDICGNDFHAKAYKEYNGDNIWTGKWICSACYRIPLHIRLLKKKELKDRVCYICRKKGSYKEIQFRYYNEKGIWYRNSYICSKCKAKEYYNDKKSIMNFKTGNLDKYSTTGKGIIGEAIIAKVRNIDILSIIFDNFETTFDLSRDIEYGNIQVKLRIWKLKRKGDWKCGAWDINLVGHRFDMLFVICISQDGCDIERIYAIPKVELSNTTGITIYEGSISRYSRWDKFRIDEKPYNESFHNLMLFLGDRRYFGIEDINKWICE